VSWQDDEFIDRMTETITQSARVDAVIYFAEALSRVRALSEHESIVLERAISAKPRPDRRWTPAEDGKLLKMSKARIRAVDMAETLRRTPEAVRRRLCDLRKKERVK
jgi:hypothetical protein